MGKVVLIVMACTVVVLIASVIKEAARNQSEPPKQSETSEKYVKRLFGNHYQINNHDILAITDPETGCQYIVWLGDRKEHVGLSPRYDREGKIICISKQQIDDANNTAIPTIQ